MEMIIEKSYCKEWDIEKKLLNRVIESHQRVWSENFTEKEKLLKRVIEKSCWMEILKSSELLIRVFEKSYWKCNWKELL